MLSVARLSMKCNVIGLLDVTSWGIWGVKYPQCWGKATGQIWFLPTIIIGRENLLIDYLHLVDCEGTALKCYFDFFFFSSFLS